MIAGRRVHFGFPAAARRRCARVAAPLTLLALAACDTPTSMLAGAGRDAVLVERLFWIMLAAAALIWVLVNGIAFYAARTEANPERERVARLFVVWCGMIVPTVVLVALLVGGMLLLRDMRGPRPDFEVNIDGEQFWWRVGYDTPAGRVVTANEIRLPAGRTVGLALSSTGVIHSFWAPALGGKMDLIPGRTNRMTLTPLEPGRWGGNCAEFCGTAHAQMRFEVEVMPAPDFDRWLAAEAAPAQVASDAGLAVFTSAGCGACHAVRGTGNAGTTGPDLTHLASRRTMAAGILPLDRETLAAWIRDPDAMKPGALMPAYPDLKDDAMQPLLDFLTGLK